MLFNFYLETHFYKARVYQLARIAVKEILVNNIKYADYRVISINLLEDLQRLLSKTPAANKDTA